MRAEPYRRRMLRNAVPEQPEEFIPERDMPTIYSRPREATKEYKAFRKAGEKRRGTFTARETGAREMAVQGEIGRLKEALGREKKQATKDLQEARKQARNRWT